MFKKIILVILVSISVMSAKDIVVIADISQGITLDEAKNLDSIINPTKSKIYTSKDRFSGHIFTAKEKAHEKFNGTYISKGDSKKGWRRFVGKVYSPYIKIIANSNSGKKDSIQVVEKDIVILIDTSGSMKKSNLANSVINKLNKMLKPKGEKVNIALVTFDGHKTFNKSENSRVVLNFTNDIGEISRAIGSINFTNLNTVMADGLELSIDLLKKRKTSSKMILLISDGDISDEALSLQQKQEAGQYNITIKPHVIGGENISVLQKLSTNGKTYDLTMKDLADSILPPKPLHLNSLFYNFSALTDSIFKKTKTKDGILIIYSTMINHSDFYEFNVVPNLSDDLFYNELMEKLKEEHLNNIDFNSLKVYVRLIGNPSLQKANELKIFWKRFIEEHKGEVIRIGSDDLALDEMGY